MRGMFIPVIHSQSCGSLTSKYNMISKSALGRIILCSFTYLLSFINSSSGLTYHLWTFFVPEET